METIYLFFHSNKAFFARSFKDLPRTVDLCVLFSLVSDKLLDYNETKCEVDF